MESTSNSTSVSTSTLVNFENSELWFGRYQRNNKHSGLKNLRCFPYCSHPHRVRGFCGRPAVLKLTTDSKPKDLRIVAGFRKSPKDVDRGKNNFVDNLEIGSTLKKTEIDASIRHHDDPFLPFFGGEFLSEDAELDDDGNPYAAQSSSSSSSFSQDSSTSDPSSSAATTAPTNTNTSSNGKSTIEGTAAALSKSQSSSASTFTSTCAIDQDANNNADADADVDTEADTEADAEADTEECDGYRNRMNSSKNAVLQDAPVTPGVYRILFNKNKRGWHYKWIANKHTCDVEHVLRAFVFAPVAPTDPETMKCIAITDSPPFTIFCRRRQRSSVERLPPQLQSEVHLTLRASYIDAKSKLKDSPCHGPMANSTTSEERNVPKSSSSSSSSSIQTRPEKKRKSVSSKDSSSDSDQFVSQVKAAKTTKTKTKTASRAKTSTRGKTTRTNSRKDADLASEMNQNSKATENGSKRTTRSSNRKSRSTRDLPNNATEHRHHLIESIPKRDDGNDDDDDAEALSETPSIAAEGKKKSKDKSRKKRKVSKVEQKQKQQQQQLLRQQESEPLCASQHGSVHLSRGNCNDDHTVLQLPSSSSGSSLPFSKSPGISSSTISKKARLQQKSETDRHCPTSTPSGWTMLATKHQPSNSQYQFDFPYGGNGVADPDTSFGAAYAEGPCYHYHPEQGPTTPMLVDDSDNGDLGSPSSGSVSNLNQCEQPRSSSYQVSFSQSSESHGGLFGGNEELAADENERDFSLDLFGDIDDLPTSFIGFTDEDFGGMLSGGLNGSGQYIFSPVITQTPQQGHHLQPQQQQQQQQQQQNTQDGPTSGKSCDLIDVRPIDESNKDAVLWRVLAALSRLREKTPEAEKGSDTTSVSSTPTSSSSSSFSSSSSSSSSLSSPFSSDANSESSLDQKQSVTEQPEVKDKQKAKDKDKDGNSGEHEPLSINRLGMTELEDFSSSIAQCLDFLLPENEAHAAEGGATNENDNSVIFESSETRQGNYPAIEPKMQTSGQSWREVMEGLALFLVEEQSFSDEIGRVYAGCQAGSSNTDVNDLQREFFVVLEKHIRAYLNRLDMSLNDLDALLMSSESETSLHEYDSGEARKSVLAHIKHYSQQNALPRAIPPKFSIEDVAPTDVTPPGQNIVGLTSELKSESGAEREAKSETQREAESEASRSKLNRGVHSQNGDGHFTDEDSTPPSSSPSSPSSNCDVKMTDVGNSNQSRSTSLPDLGYGHVLKALPEEMNFSGHWQRPESTLKSLESIREFVGVPWVMRKMFKQMESAFTMIHTPTEIRVWNKRKLCTSGFFSYTLDGKDHSFDMPSPLPGDTKPLLMSYCGWHDMAQQRMILIQTYSKRHRVMRTIKKSAEGQELQSVVSLQSRADYTSPWQNKIVVNAKAVRLREDAMD